MQRIITVKLADVYPLEDEYGNQYASRDYSTKANKDYVRELAESMRSRGIPDEPIAVVADGGIYRIKTGNSRVMAMRELGTRECPAVIDDDDTVQSVLEAVVRTDTKKKYEAVEMSRFVQQLMMFGDDEYVSENTGIKPEKVKRIRKARMVVDDAGDDMTLDRMLLIEEFSDDPEAVRELTTCKEADAAWKADGLRRKRAEKERRDAFAAAFGLQGVPVAGDRAEVEGMAYFVSVPEPAEVAAYLPPKWEDGQVKALITSVYNGARAEIYVSPELSGDKDAEAAAIRRQEDAYRDALRAMGDSIDAWFWAGFAEGRPMTGPMRLCAQAFKGSWVVDDALESIPDEAQAAAKNGGLSKLDHAIGYTQLKSSLRNPGIFARSLAKGELDKYRRDDIGNYLDFVDAFREAGWDPGDATALVAELEKLFEDYINGSEEDDD